MTQVQRPDPSELKTPECVIEGAELTFFDCTVDSDCWPERGYQPGDGQSVDPSERANLGMLIAARASINVSGNWRYTRRPWPGVTWRVPGPRTGMLTTYHEYEMDRGSVGEPPMGRPQRRQGSYP
jgi:hypothetical protein